MGSVNTIKVLTISDNITVAFCDTSGD